MAAFQSNIDITGGGEYDLDINSGQTEHKIANDLNGKFNNIQTLLQNQLPEIDEADTLPTEIPYGKIIIHDGKVYIGNILNQPALIYPLTSNAEIGDVLITTRSNPGEEWLLCDGSSVNKTQFPSLIDKLNNPYRPLINNNYTVASNNVAYGNGIYAFLSGKSILYNNDPSTVWSSNTLNVNFLSYYDIKFVNNTWIVMGLVSSTKKVYIGYNSNIANLSLSEAFTITTTDFVPTALQFAVSDTNILCIISSSSASIKLEAWYTPVLTNSFVRLSNPVPTSGIWGGTNLCVYNDIWCFNFSNQVYRLNGTLSSSARFSLVSTLSDIHIIYHIDIINNQFYMMYDTPITIENSIVGYDVRIVASNNAYTWNSIANNIINVQNLTSAKLFYDKNNSIFVVAYSTNNNSFGNVMCGHNIGGLSNLYALTTISQPIKSIVVGDNAMLVACSNLLYYTSNATLPSINIPGTYAYIKAK